MHRILIISDSPGWCFARRADALQRYAPDDFDVTVTHYGGRDVATLPYALYDLIFLLAPNKAAEVRETLARLQIDVPLVVSYNSGVGRSGYRLQEALLAADWVVVNNYAAWACGARSVHRYNACNISNGVDLSTFRPTVPIAKRPPRVLWVASESKARDEHDVKGYQLILRPLERVLPTRGIETDFRAVDGGYPLSARQMNGWYNSGSVVVCASSSEGTPNIALEGAAAGCVVVTSPVGNMPELISSGCNGVIVHDRQTIPFFEAIQHAIRERVRLSEAVLWSIRTWDWKQRAPYFYSLFRAVIERGAASIRPYSYLSVEPLEVP